MIWLLHAGWLAFWIGLAGQAVSGRWPRRVDLLVDLNHLALGAMAGISLGLLLRGLMLARRVSTAREARATDIALANGCRVHGLPLAIGLLALAPKVDAAPFASIPIAPQFVDGAIVMGGSVTAWRAPGDRRAAGTSLTEVAPASERTSRSLAPSVPMEPASAAARPEVLVDRMTLTIETGERLSQAVERFLRSDGYSLQWNTSIDYVVRHGWSVKARSLDEALAAALMPHGLSGTVWETNRVVEVEGSNGGVAR
jgi:hypothetical protein